jgi:alpha-D-xyloside xylohydrolase
MEVGPTRNVAFWNFPRNPQGAPDYDTELIAAWRMYARLHDKLTDYSYAAGKTASKTGVPIVRPLFMVDPKAPAAWTNWWTYQYGSDLLVSPIWEKGKREQEVYLPSGARWKDAWDNKVYAGGQTIKVKADLHQLPIFVKVGSKVQLGDLNKEWKDAMEIAAKKPDLKALESEVITWFSQNKK